MTQETEKPSEAAGLRPGENPSVGVVSGYRKQSDEELRLINALKAAGPELEVGFASLEQFIKDRGDVGVVTVGDSLRALALAKTNIQQGYMWAIRAIAAPQGFV